MLPTDVAGATQMEEAAALVEQRFGPIDVWVNNAMVSVLSPALQMRAEECQRVTNVTYLGYVHGTLAALRRMVPRDQGVIVQVGSALAYRSIPLQSTYCAGRNMPSNGSSSRSGLSSSTTAAASTLQPCNSRR